MVTDAGRQGEGASKLQIVYPRWKQQQHEESDAIRRKQEEILEGSKAAGVAWRARNSKTARYSGC